MASCMRDHVLRYFPLAERACFCQVAAALAEPEGPRAGELRAISDCHLSEGASQNRIQIPILDTFYLLSAPRSLG
jgi:hypothetical protein